MGPLTGAKLRPGCDNVPGATGRFGYDKTNPIPTNGITGELAYLNTLRFSSGVGCNRWKRVDATAVAHPDWYKAAIVQYRLSREDMQPMSLIAGFAWKQAGMRPRRAVEYAMQTIYFTRNGSPKERADAETTWQSAIRWDLDTGIETMGAGLECVRLACAPRSDPDEMESFYKCVGTLFERVRRLLRDSAATGGVPMEATDPETGQGFDFRKAIAAHLDEAAYIFAVGVALVAYSSYREASLDLVADRFQVRTLAVEELMSNERANMPPAVLRELTAEKAKSFATQQILRAIENARLARNFFKTGNALSAWALEPARYVNAFLPLQAGLADTGVQLAGTDADQRPDRITVTFGSVTAQMVTLCADSFL